MAVNEEIVELGFEGVDKFADKYHDKVYDHLPAWRKKQQKQEAQDRRAGQKRREDQAQPGKEQQEQQQQQPQPQQSRRDSAAERNENNSEDDRSMSYAPSPAPSYAPNRRQDYRGHQDDRDVRYAREESIYQRGPNAGQIEMRDNEAYPRAARAGYEAGPQVFTPPPEYGTGYNDRRDRGRPAPSRMRSNSWSPRNERQQQDDSRRRRHSRSRSRSRSRSSSNDGSRNQRIAATFIGGLVGGYAGNRARRGQKFDTAATIAGAVIGGLASREIAEKVGSKKHDGKEKRQGKERAWEEKYGDGGRDDDRRRGSRESRG